MEEPAVKRHYEYIVVGCGGIGSGAVYWLSKRVGNGVLGLEQFKLGHVNGGSQDFSRIIRLQYQDVKLTRLTPDAHRAYERMTGTELHRRFPQFTVGDEFDCIYQKDGGLVDAAMGNSVHIQLARAHGADVIDDCPVTRIDRDDHGRTIVYTTRGVFTCRRVVVTAGAWINHVLGSVGAHIPVVVTQEQVTYFATPNVKDYTKERFPIWVYHDPKYDLYGLPSHGNSGSKIGIDAGGNLVTPETRTYIPDPERERACVEFLKAIIPSSLGPIMETKTCLYTMTLDRTFVIDSLASRGWPEVLFCCGAGNAFKFASLFGKILSELAIDGKTQYPIKGFEMNRPAITDPNFKAKLSMVVNNQVNARL